MTKYAYHPGNVAHSTAVEVGQSMAPLCATLGIELVPLEGATSCGAGVMRLANKKLQVALNARTFAMAEAAGLDIITPCASTAGNLSEDLAMLKADPALLDSTNQVLEKTCGLTFSGDVKVHHLLTVLVEDVGLDALAAAVKNPIDFDIACYYGPHMQQAGACGDDDVFDPTYMEQIVGAIGGRAIDWSCRMMSTGAASIFGEEPTALKQTAAILADAKSEGAQLMLSACNLSHMMLDVYQLKAGRAAGARASMPVSHFVDVVAFALGHHNDRLAQLRTRCLVIGD